MSTATRTDGGIRLDARKSWITAAGEADSYVWSSRPVAAEGPMSLWLVPADAPGLSSPGAFDGLGLRGNRSAPIEASGVVVPEQAALGADGAGLDLALQVVLPWFLVLSGGLQRRPDGSGDGGERHPPHFAPAWSIWANASSTSRSPAPTTPECGSPPTRRPRSSATR